MFMFTGDNSNDQLIIVIKLIIIILLTWHCSLSTVSVSLMSPVTVLLSLVTPLSNTFPASVNQKIKGTYQLCKEYWIWLSQKYFPRFCDFKDCTKQYKADNFQIPFISRHFSFSKKSYLDWDRMLLLCRKSARVVVLVNFRLLVVRPESYFRNEDFCFRQSWKSVK